MESLPGTIVTELMRKCSILPIDRDSVTIPRFEAVPFTDFKRDSIIEYSQLTLRPHKLVVYAEADRGVPNEYLYNSIMREQLKYNINESILFGTGTGMPLGITNSPATNRVERHYSMPQNIHNMYERFTPCNSPTWLVNSMDDVVGITKELSGTNANCSTLLGYPVICTDAQPPYTKDGGIILADLSKYCIATRPPQVAEALDYRFNDTKQVRVTYRIDGAPTVFKTSYGTSPFVVLGGFEVHDNETGETVVICLYCGERWDKGQVICWDGHRGCGNSLLPPGGTNVVCHYCGRIWPGNKHVCWNGADGCGGSLPLR